MKTLPFLIPKIALSLSKLKLMVVGALVELYVTGCLAHPLSEGPTQLTKRFAITFGIQSVRPEGIWLCLTLL
jgi:hypothetical protein